MNDVKLHKSATGKKGTLSEVVSQKFPNKICIQCSMNCNQCINNQYGIYDYWTY